MMSNQKNKSQPTLDKLVSLCKRRGFVYPSSEIYGGFSAIYDYGSYGIELKNNLTKLWWKNMVQMRREVVGLDSGIFMHPRTWEASGHTTSFDDPQMECHVCHNRIRADHLLEKYDLDVDRWPIDRVNAEIEKLKNKGEKIQCDKCGSADLTEAKSFNLLVLSNLGSPTGELQKLTDDEVVYLRGETCQGIYLNYKNIIDTMRVKIPFGIAQIGKAFRNEIVARQFVFRTREFEQMELQYFIHESETKKWFDFWKQERWNFYKQILKFDMSNFRFKPHEKLAHYASAAEDIEYNFSSLGGFKELEGIHARGDWDLAQHTKFSGKKLDYLDEKTGERFTPHIVEVSVGLTRTLLVALHEAYNEEQLDSGETRIVLKFKPEIAPIKVAILPLQKKPEFLSKKAQEIWQLLATRWMCEYDESGSIGKRYRRQDEIGTPFCVTIDFDTIGEGDSSLENTITVRDRDTMRQERLKIIELKEWLSERLENNN